MTKNGKNEVYVLKTFHSLEKKGGKENRATIRS